MTVAVLAGCWGCGGTGGGAPWERDAGVEAQAATVAAGRVEASAVATGAETGSEGGFAQTVAVEAGASPGADTGLDGGTTESGATEAGCSGWCDVPEGRFVGGGETWCVVLGCEAEAGACAVRLADGRVIGGPC